MILTKPPSGIVFHRQGGTGYDQPLYTKFKVSVYVHPLRSYEWWCKMQKMGWFGVLRGQSRSWAMSPFDRTHTTSYLTLIETMRLSKVADFNLPHLHLAPPLWRTPDRNFAEIFGTRKLGSLGYRVVLFA